MQTTLYSTADINNVLATLDAAKIDELPCGAIQLDRDGKVLFYNSAEGQITGRDPKLVIGKNFFTEVAPCTHTPEFFGEFEKLLTDPNHVAAFKYTFDYNMKPTKVTVTMRKARSGDAFWILVTRL